MTDLEPEPSVQVRIDWHIPEGTTSKFANHVLIQRTEDAVFLHFFELRPPIVFGSAEEQHSQLKVLGTVRADCVASIVMPVGQLEAVITALGDVRRPGSTVTLTNEMTSP